MIQPSGRVLCAILEDGCRRHLLETAKRVERRRVQRVREARSAGTPNEVRKMEYVDAFLDARAQQMQAVRATAEYRGRLSRLPPAVLEPECVRPAAAATALDRPTTNAEVPFGAWRETLGKDEQAALARDRALHCIVRGAKTPPALSAMALRRRVPLEQHRRSVQKLLAFLSTWTPGDGGGYESSVRQVRAHSRLCVLMARCSSEISRSAADTVREDLLSRCLQHTARSNSWQAAFELLRLHVSARQTAHQPGRARGGKAATVIPAGDAHPEDLRRQLPKASSVHLAVLFEAVRENVPLYGCPPPEEVQRLVTYVRDALDVEVNTVVAAPTLALLQPGDRCAGDLAEEAAAAQMTWQAVLDFAIAVLAQRKAPAAACEANPAHEDGSRGGRTSTAETARQRCRHWDGRVYLPGIAWGELLRALHRFGASLDIIRSVVDDVTDDSATKNGAKMLRDAHVWSAYVSCCGSDWQHAVEVYTRNRKEYGVADTADITASVMEALLCSPAPGAGSRWQLALEYHRRLIRKEGRLLTSTCSVLTALIAAYSCGGQIMKIVDLVASFDRFVGCFGISRQEYRLWAALEPAGTVEEGLTAAPIDSLVALLAARSVSGSSTASASVVATDASRANDEALRLLEEEAAGGSGGAPTDEDACIECLRWIDFLLSDPECRVPPSLLVVARTAILHAASPPAHATVDSVAAVTGGGDAAPDESLGSSDRDARLEAPTDAMFY